MSSQNKRSIVYALISLENIRSEYVFSNWGIERLVDIITLFLLSILSFMT